MGRLTRTQNIHVRAPGPSAPTQTTYVIPSEENYSGPRKSTLCIMACHSTTPTKVKLIVNNLKYLSKIADAFVLIDSAECQSNNLQSQVRNTHPLLNIDFKYIDNDKVLLCHAKYLYYLQNFSYSQYEQLIITNDSFVICRSIENYGSLMNENYDMVGLLASNQIKYHFPDFLRSYKTRSIGQLIEYFNNNRHRVHNEQSLIMVYEIESTNVFGNRKALYEADDPGVNIHYDNSKISRYLLHANYPVIKLKRMQQGHHPAIDKMLNEINF